MKHRRHSRNTKGRESSIKVIWPKFQGRTTRQLRIASSESILPFFASRPFVSLPLPSLVSNLALTPYIEVCLPFTSPRETSFDTLLSSSAAASCARLLSLSASSRFGSIYITLSFSLGSTRAKTSSPPPPPSSQSDFTSLADHELQDCCSRRRLWPSLPLGPGALDGQDTLLAFATYEEVSRRTRRSGRCRCSRQTLHPEDGKGSQIVLL
jgi:hypothetical protein